MENKLRERVRQYCEYMNIRVSQFEKKAGLSNGYFNQVSKKPSEAKLDSIAKAHPNLGIDWLCTGRGEMIIETIKPNDGALSQQVLTGEIPVAEDALVTELRSQIEKLEAKVDYLNQELGEKNALLKMMRQKGEEAAKSAGVSLSANAV